MLVWPQAANREGLPKNNHKIFSCAEYNPLLYFKSLGSVSLDMFDVIPHIERSKYAAIPPAVSSIDS